MEQHYDIYFAGQLVEGFDEGSVRKNLSTLFKINDTALDKLFSGKLQPVKRGVDKPGAIKYKTAMARAGAVAVIKAHRTAAEPGAPPTAARETTSGADPEDLPSSSDIESPADSVAGTSMADRIAALAGDPDDAKAADMTLAPTGSDVLSADEREVVEAPNIDTSGIQLAPEAAESEPAPDDAPPAPDTSHLSMGEVGEDIPHLVSLEEPLDPDTSHLSMGEVGEDIPHLEVEQELLDPDTSDMSLAPEGSEVLEEQYKHVDSAQAPNTDHLDLEETGP